jgi:hypothetical protein
MWTPGVAPNKQRGEPRGGRMQNGHASLLGVLVTTAVFFMLRLGDDVLGESAWAHAPAQTDYRAKWSTGSRTGASRSRNPCVVSCSFQLVLRGGSSSDSGGGSGSSSSDSGPNARPFGTDAPEPSPSRRGINLQLWEASRRGLAGMLGRLVEQGAEVDAAYTALDGTRKNALHFAVLSGHTEAVQALIRAGADVACVDDEVPANPLCTPLKRRMTCVS